MVAFRAAMIVIFKISVTGQGIPRKYEGLTGYGRNTHCPLWDELRRMC